MPLVTRLAEIGGEAALVGCTGVARSLFRLAFAAVLGERLAGFHPDAGFTFLGHIEQICWRRWA